MRTVTILDIKTRARERADAVGDTLWVTDAELGRYIDAAYTELVDMLVVADIHLFEVEDTITTDGVDDTYDLPTDFYKLLAVDYRWSTTPSPGRYTNVPVITFGDRNRYDMLNVSGPYGAFASGYRVIGNTIKFSPSPPSGQVYRITYAPCPAELAGLADYTEIDGIAGWDELLVILTAIRMYQKEDAAITQSLKDDLDRMRGRIAQMGVDRQPVQSISDYGEDWDRSDYRFGRGWGY